MRVKLVFLLLATAVSTTAAADLTVMSAGAVASALVKLTVDYEREFGRDVLAVFGTGPEIERRLAARSDADVLIAPAPVMAHAARLGKVMADTQAEVARVGVGIVVRHGAPAPNVPTVDALKEALRRADRVVYNEASSGQYLEKLFERMAVVDEIRPRTTRYATGAQVLEHMANGGRGDLGFGPITEIRDYEAKGVTFVGPLPREVQHYTTYLAAVMTEARAPEAGRDFVRYLTSAAARRTFAATGVETGQ